MPQPRMRQELVQALEAARLHAAERGHYVTLDEIGRQLDAGGSAAAISRTLSFESEAPMERLADAYALELGTSVTAIYRAALKALTADPDGDTYTVRRTATSEALENYRNQYRAELRHRRLVEREN